MGRKRRQKQNKDQRKDKRQYENIVKENEIYQHYYKEQKCFDVSQFDDFLEKMRMPLPAVFRISGYKKHSLQLLKNMKEIYFKDLTEIKIAEEVIEPPTSLPWYPKEFAWKTNLNRTQIRKVPQLQKFHTFLIAETESGHITRQEAVSMIPPLLLDIKPEHKVLDMCAAPGSKTAQIIELLHQDDTKAIPDGLCIANDKDNKRCYMLVHQMNRLNSPSTIIVNHDAATFPQLYLKDEDGKEKVLKYDRVLCDVPCSGDGTMRKNVDVWIKWNVSNAMYLHGIQLRILMRGLELLNTGGKLVYSTCSINPIEDEAVVAAALSKCAGSVQLVDVEMPGLKWSPGVSSWRVMDHSRRWYSKHSEVAEEKTSISKTMFPPEDDLLLKEMRLEKCMRLLPHHQDTGGFFVAVLYKKSPLPWEKPEVNESDSKKCAEDDSSACKQPPRKKPRWVPGFKEDPFIFFTDEEQPIVEQLRSFFGLSSFPFNQLLTRTKQEKKKHLYFVSKILKNVIETNAGFLKVINTGVRMFSRADNSQHDLKCDFRTVQSGVDCVESFMTRQLIRIGFDDVIKLLVEEQPKYTCLSSDLREKLEQMDPGSVLFKYQPTDESSQLSCDLLLCGWKGYVSARLYICRNEKMHFLNLCAHPIPDHLLPNKNSRRARAEGDIRIDKDATELEEENNEEDANIVDKDADDSSSVSNELSNGDSNHQPS